MTDVRKKNSECESEKGQAEREREGVELLRNLKKDNLIKSKV